MKKMFKKVMAIVLTIAMVAGMSSLTFAETDSSLTAEMMEYGSYLPAGVEVAINVAAGNIDGTSQIQIVNVATNAVEASALASDAVALNLTVEKGLNTYKAVALDSNGSVLAESDEFSIDGYAEKENKEIWNLDFEGCTFVPYNDLTWTVLNKDGSQVKSSYNNSTFEGHLGGSSENSVTVTTEGIPEDAKYGESVKVDGSTAANCQLNYMYLASNGPVTTVAFDWAISDDWVKEDGWEEKENVPTVQIFATKTNADYALPILTAGADGKFYIGDEVGTYETNKWYNIKQVTDFSSGVCTTYIDNVLVDATEFSTSTITSLTLVAASCETQDVTMYFDNVDAYNSKLVSCNPGIAVSVNSNAISVEGTKLPVDVTLTELEDATKIQLIKVSDNSVIDENSTDLSDGLELTLSRGLNSYKVVALNADGEILAQSAEFTADGYRETKKEEIWNLDFEGCTFVPYENLTWSVLNKDGAQVKSSYNNSTFEGHLGGSSDNSIVVTTEGVPENAKYGESVKITGTTSANCQMSYMYLASTASASVVSFDWAIADVESVQVFGMKTNAGYVLPILRTNSDGEFVIGSDIVGTYEVNKWYNIKQITDLEHKISNTYIDNVLVHTATPSDSITKFELVSSNCDNTASTFYLDNFVAYDTVLTNKEPTVSVDYAADTIMPAGVTIPVKLNCEEFDNISKYQIVKASDESLVAEIEGTTSATVQLMVGKGINKYKAIALDASGNVIVTSAEFAIKGYDESLTNCIWDIDFEGVTAVPDSSLAWVVFHQDGAPIRSANTNDTFEGHLGGSSDNSIVVTNEGTPENAKYGESVKVSGSTSANCQMNYMTIGSTGPVVAASFDWAIAQKASTQVYAMKTDGGWTLPIIRSNEDGQFVIASEVVGTYETDKWYNIKQVTDLENGLCYTFIDNNLVHTATVSGTTKLILISTNCDNTASTFYLDNFLAYSYSNELVFDDLAVDFKIDGESAVGFKAGNLTMDVTAFDNVGATNLTAVAAVYESNKLVLCKLVDFDFTNVDEPITETVDMGSVTAGQNVKVMLLKSSNMVSPVCEVAELR